MAKKNYYSGFVNPDVLVSQNKGALDSMRSNLSSQVDALKNKSNTISSSVVDDSMENPDVNLTNEQIVDIAFAAGRGDESAKKRLDRYFNPQKGKTNTISDLGYEQDVSNISSNPLLNKNMYGNILDFGVSRSAFGGDIDRLKSEADAAASNARSSIQKQANINKTIDEKNKSIDDSSFSRSGMKSDLSEEVRRGIDRLANRNQISDTSAFVNKFGKYGSEQSAIPTLMALAPYLGYDPSAIKIKDVMNYEEPVVKKKKGMQNPDRVDLIESGQSWKFSPTGAF